MFWRTRKRRPDMPAKARPAQLWWCPLWWPYSKTEAVTSDTSPRVPGSPEGVTGRLPAMPGATRGNHGRCRSEPVRHVTSKTGLTGASSETLLTCIPRDRKQPGSGARTREPGDEWNEAP